MELNGRDLAGRQRIVGAIVLGVGLLFVIRLFQMQVTTDEWKNRAERLTEEFKAIGFYLSGHPLDDYMGALRRKDIKTLDEVTAQGVLTAAMVDREETQ